MKTGECSTDKYLELSLEKSSLIFKKVISGEGNISFEQDFLNGISLSCEVINHLPSRTLLIFCKYERGHYTTIRRK